MNKAPLRLWLPVAFCLAITPGFGQSPSSESEQIRQRLKELTEHLVSPDKLLDPKLTPDARSKHLEELRGNYELQLTPAGEIQHPNGNMSEAVLPVRVHFKTANSELDNSDAEATFIRREDGWYFKDYSFLSTPTVLILVWLVCMAIGILYALGALRYYWKESKRRGTPIPFTERWRVFIPYFWFKKEECGDKTYHLNQIKEERFDPPRLAVLYYFGDLSYQELPAMWDLESSAIG
jgi:hypothetical protein